MTADEWHDSCPNPMYGGEKTASEGTGQAEGDFCRARSKLHNPRKPESYFICTNDVDHPDPRHTACDGQGHVIARWRSRTSPIEVWGPWGVTWV